MPGLTNRRWPLGLAGLLALLALGGLALGFVITYADRVLPGVRVGGVDVSGLDRAEASSRLAVAFASPQDGRIVLRTGEGEPTIRYTDVRRRNWWERELHQHLGAAPDAHAARTSRFRPPVGQSSATAPG